MIDFLMNILSFILAIGLSGWILIKIFKFNLSNYKGRDKKKNKELIKLIKEFEKGFNKLYRIIFFALGILFNLLLSVFVAIGSKPLIYKMNFQLGEGYSIFASYVLAIGIYILLPRWFAIDKEGDKLI